MRHSMLLAVATGVFFAAISGTGGACPGRAATLARRTIRDMSLRTGDGFELRINRNGVAGILLGSRNIARISARTGLWLQDYKTGAESPVGFSGNGRTVDVGNLDVKATVYYKAVGNVIVVEGSVESTVPRPRAVNIIFGLPVGGQGLWWWDSIDSRRRVLPGGRYSDSTYPFCAITDPRKSIGMGMAIPPDSPCLFTLGYDSAFGLYLKIKLGLSPLASGKLRDRARFKFLLFRVDPRWGFRDAAKKYYDCSPTTFERRTGQGGLWLPSERSSRVRSPQYYAFREGGPGGLSEDKRLGILTFPYIIVGQRQLTHLSWLPGTNGEAMRILDEYRGAGDRYGLLEAIRNCGLRNAQGRMITIMRDTQWGGNSIIFPTDPSPYLYEHSNRATVAKETLRTVARWLKKAPGISGVYVDSLAAWGRFEDFSPDHIRYARIPLSYDEGTGDPVIPNKNSQQEFLDQLGRMLHSRGKLVFCNGVRPGFEFNSFACDILGVEGMPNVQHLRTIAYQKPALCILPETGNVARLEDLFRRCASLGIFPSLARQRENGAVDDRILHRYVPIIKKIAHAGWEPVTYAECAEPSVRVERFGPNGGKIYFTLHNTDSAPVYVHLRIDRAELKIPARCPVRELLTGTRFNSLDDIELRLAGGGLAVIEGRF